MSRYFVLKQEPDVRDLRYFDYNVKTVHYCDKPGVLILKVNYTNVVLVRQRIEWMVKYLRHSWEMNREV
jgi:hypothetical protein